MRISIVVVAAVVGWFWFASDDPAPHRDAPAARPRAANVSNLAAQLAAAERRVATAPDREGDLTELAAQFDATRDADLTDLAAQTDGDGSSTTLTSVDTIDPELLDELLVLPSNVRDAALAEALGRELTIDDLLMLGIDDDVADVDVVAHEVVRVESHVPIIDHGWTSDCGGVVEYTVDIPMPGRTFESALGAAASPQGHDEGVSFSSGATSENVYVVE